MSVCLCTYETLVTRSVVTVGGVYDSGSHVSRVTQLERGGTGKKRSELFWSLNCLTPFTSNMVGACIKRPADDIHRYVSHSNPQLAVWKPGTVIADGNNTLKPMKLK